MRKEQLSSLAMFGRAKIPRAKNPGAVRANNRSWAHLALLLLLLMVVPAGAALAATFTVTNLNDTGAGSLRQAITDANGGAGADTIAFQAGLTGTINVTSSLPTFTGATTVTGPGPTALTVNGGSFTIFSVASGINLQMSGLRVTGGAMSAGLNAAQLDVGGGTATVSNSAFENAGGLSTVPSSAVASFISLTMTNVTIANSIRDGLWNGGTAVLTNVTISGSGRRGIDQLSGNTISTTLVNCTIADNGNNGLTVNLRPGESHTITLKNTIFSNPDLDLRVVQSGGPALNLISQGNNLFSDATLSPTAAGDFINTDPLLDILANYGGNTRTMALRPGSPAINAGSASGAPSTDQRGFARVGATDIGAFESQGFTLALAAGNNQSTGTSTNFASPLSVTASYVSGGPMNSGQVTFTPPGSGASATIAGNPATISNGTASTGTVTANATAGGPYTVSASMPGVTAVNFSLTNTANTPPSITAGAALTRLQGSTGTVSTIATVSDGQTAAGSLVVTATTVPTGLTATSITNTAGTVTANVAAGCTATVGANTVGLTVTDGDGLTATADLTVNVAANNIVVTNGNNSGVGSLRQAIADACASSTITFQAGVTTVTLTSAELLINKNLIINGGIGVTVTRGAAAQFRIFNVLSGNTVAMNNLAVTNGNHPDQAGGILSSGNLTMTDCTISGNTAPQGGGIQNDSVLTMTNCTVSGNNATSLGGGGLSIFGTTTTLTNCTFSGNQASRKSGAIAAAGTLTLTNCTIANNQAGLTGGGLAVNSATVTLRNTIVAENTAPAGGDNNIDGNVSGTSNNNLVGPGGTGGLTNGVNGNQVGVANALVGTIAANGGPTQTCALLPGSSAINAGTTTGAPTTDQRGIARVGNVDIGAFESRGFTMALSGGNNQSVGTGTAFALPLSVAVSSASSEPVNGGQVTFTPPGSGASATIAGNPAAIAGGIASTGTVTANATAGGPYTVSASMPGVTAVNFSLTNTAVNTPPTISDVVNQTISEDATTGALAFNIGDAQTAAASLTLSGSSSNLTLVPNANIVFDGSGGNRTLTITPAANLFGISTITVTVNDGATNTSDTFLLIVNAVNDLPSFIAGVNQTHPSGINTAQTVAGWATAISDGDPEAMQGLTFNVSNTNNGLFTMQPTVNSITGTLNYTPNGTSGSATVSVSLTDDAAAGGAALTSAVQIFTITVQAGTSLTIDDASVLEGNAANTSAVFTIRRANNSGAFSVDVATSDGTATAGTDYTGVNTTLNFTAGGALTQTVAVPVIGDTAVEPSETFNVTLSNPTNGATLSDATGVGTISNDDFVAVPGLGWLGALVLIGLMVVVVRVRG